MSNAYRYLCVSRRAFTLVELLVVVAIIALLLSILLPSLTAAREQGKRVKCLANMRDIMSASVAYANSDTTAQPVPVLPTIYDRRAVSASRKAVGGKSGLHDLQAATGFPEVRTWYAEDYGMWSTKNGFGPNRRPLNKFIYRSIGRRSFQEVLDMSVEQAKLDEKLDFDVFRCPSDVGYEAGKDGTGDAVIHGYWLRWPGETPPYRSTVPVYDAWGSSYGADSILYGTDDWLLTFGTFLRPYEQIPEPARTTTYIENKGFYAAYWNNWDQPDDGLNYAFGWHGTMREHNVAFADGHTAPVLFEARTDVAGVDDQGNVIHSGNFVTRGGTTADMEYVPPEDNFMGAGSFLFDEVAFLLMSGDGWQNHCQPAPGIFTEFSSWDGP